MLNSWLSRFIFWIVILIVSTIIGFLAAYFMFLILFVVRNHIMTFWEFNFWFFDQLKRDMKGGDE